MNSAVKQYPSKIPGLIGRWASLAALLLMALPASGQLKQSASEGINFIDATLDPINSVPSKAAPYGLEIKIGSTVGGATLLDGHKITRVAVRLPNLTHSYLADLDIMLTGPDGLGVVLMSDVALNQPAGNLDIVVRDDASLSFPAGLTPTVVSGSYKPTNLSPSDEPFPDSGSPSIQAALNAFVGKKAKDTSWKLFALDDRFTDRGNVGPWELQLWVAPIVTISNRTDQSVSPADTITIGLNPDATPSAFEDEAYNIPIEVNDPDTAVSDITMSVVDISDKNIIPDAQADEGWQVTKPTSGNIWTLRLKSKLNASGNLTLRVKINDKVTDTFFPLNVRIAPRNDPPVITKVLVPKRVAVSKKDRPSTPARAQSALNTAFRLKTRMVRRMSIPS